MSWKARQSANRTVRDGRSSRRRAGDPASLGLRNKAERPQTSVMKKAVVGSGKKEPEGSRGSSCGCDKRPGPWKSPFRG